MIVSTIETQAHGRYLVSSAASSRALIGFHGYGESAETQFERLAGLAGAEQWLLVSIQGLHRFYDRRSNRVVASWMTNQDRELAIADNIAYVSKVIDRAAVGSRELPTRVFLGFSQGVAMAFRSAVAIAGGTSHVVAVGGDVPPELTSEQLGQLSSVLICRGEDDPYYGRETFDADVRRLNAGGTVVRTMVVSGGHEWSPEIALAIGEWLAGPAEAVQDVVRNTTDFRL